MSDRVFFHHLEDTVAETATHNGLPVNIGTSVVDSAYYPLAIPLEVRNSTSPSCGKWGLRSRRWGAATDASVTAGANTVTIPSGTTPDPGARTRELHIYQGSPGWVFQERVGAGYELRLRIFVDDDPPEPQIWKDGSSYKPRLRIFGSAATDDNGGTDAANLFFSSVESELPAAATGSITGTIDGENVTIYYRYDGAGSNSFTFTQLDLTIDEFWPYAAEDTSPIYDTTTGLELQDPRN